MPLFTRIKIHVNYTRVKMEPTMDRPARKAAIAAFKDRKSSYGVYAVLCLATGEAWVGQSRNLDSQQNGLWFSLKHGGSPYPTLQAAWNLHGADAFKFEDLDRLRDDFPALNRPNELKRRQSLWATRLHATAI
jgi:hypothetical protein